MDDKIYKRNISRQLLFLRTIPILVFITIITLLTRGIYDYALLFSILLAPAFFLSPTQITFDNGNIEIKKYLFLGFVTRTYFITADNLVSIKRHEEEIENADHDMTLTLTSTVIIFTFKDNKGREQSIKTKLSVKEYFMLQPKIQD